jgi:peptidoglycan/LPS O-acetylase OafA/YrhL
MTRELALKIMLVLAGLLFAAAIIPITLILWQKDQDSYETAMGLSVYFTLGVMLLIAIRNPKAFRSLIVFAAWSSFAHAAVMMVMVIHDARSRGEWLMVVVLSVIGGALIALAPRKQSPEGALQSG